MTQFLVKMEIFFRKNGTASIELTKKFVESFNLKNGDYVSVHEVYNRSEDEKYIVLILMPKEKTKPNFYLPEKSFKEIK